MGRVRALRGRVRRLLARQLGDRHTPPRRLLAPALAFAVLGVACRLLYVCDAVPALHTREQPGVRMAARYSEAARGLLAGDGILYPRHWPERSDTGLVSRPPGYPLFVAAVYRGVGESYLSVLLVQAVLGALLPVLTVYLLARVVGQRAALFGGLGAAMSPPLAYHAAELTPDSLAALLSLAVVALVWRGRRRLRRWCLAAGGLAGIASWLRPNLLLLAPALAAALPAASSRRRRSAALLMIGTAALVVLPVTARNYRLYGEFVPVSTNLGIVLWEGIADAGGQAYGARSQDLEVAEEEAERYHEPRYAQWWASPDGIARDRQRVSRCLAVVRAHPGWFAAAVLRRARAVLDVDGAAPLLQAGAAAVSADPGPESPPRWLARLSAARPSLAALQRLLAWPAPVLRFAGLILLLLLAPRRALFLLLVPAYVLAMQSPLHFEPRFALPLCAFAPAFEGIGWAWALATLGSACGGLALWRRAPGEPRAARGGRYWM